MQVYILKLHLVNAQMYIVVVLSYFPMSLS